MSGRRLLVLCVLVALVALVAGCGGSRQAATTGAPTAAELLRRYLAAMGPHERRFDRLSERVVGAVGGIDPAAPDVRWTRASRSLVPVERGYRALGTAIASVPPPAPLADEHRRLARATRSFGGYVLDVQQALAAGLPDRLARAAAADTNDLRDARAGWAKAVKRYAARLGVVPPAWLVPSPPA